jgi:D-alanyl-D-alanine endopeptidase (penicillin-binding protein 7)
VLHLALVASDNTAARVLARVSRWGTKGFVEQMNQMAAELGLRSTAFSDPSGLDKRNVSTAYDLSRLIAHAATQQEISRIMRKRSYRLRTSRRLLTVRNTNRLLGGRLDVQSGKTGYIDASGYCLATVVDVPGAGSLSVVVLGAGSNSRRFSEVGRLVDWVLTHDETLIAPVTQTD